MLPLPLEGVGDYVDLNLIVNPWQAVVACVVIFAVLIYPSMSARQTVRRVEKTLTTNNGGSTVKDQNDRIERTLADLGKKLDEHVEWSATYVKETEARMNERAVPTPTGKRFAEER